MVALKPLEESSATCGRAANRVERLPRHVGLIMDGNGRWAKARGLPRREGHRSGVEAVRRLLRHAGDRGIPYLTLYCFSSENWSRPQSEILDLMNLLKFFIRTDLAELRDAGVRIRVIGERAGIAPDIMSLIDEAETTTQGNSDLHLTVAFNYGAREELTRAVRRLCDEVQAGRLRPEDVDIRTVASALDTADLPDPDLIIRTSGEERLSNFLLWQSAYAELVFLPVLWPDFTANCFEEALAEFASRERRYGGLDAR